MMNITDKRAIYAEATRAGITSESVGEWMNIAARNVRLAKRTDRSGEQVASCWQEAAYAYRRAIEIADTWGAKLECYSMSPGVREKANEGLALAMKALGAS
jgi:hypothetical protein